MRLSAERSTVLRALIQTLARVPTETRREVRKHTKSVAAPAWKKALSEQAPPARMYFDRLVTPSTVYISDRGVALRSGRAGRFPRETEFGAYREDYNTYNSRGKSVTRRTQRQFWHFIKKGRVVYPAASEIIPRIGSLWAQTAVRTIHELIEKVSR